MATTKRDAIVDAAEALFAVRGFDGVSMRMVADTASVGLGVLTHHFRTKDQLFSEVVGRRAEVINSARRQALGALSRPDLESLLAAFFQPYVDLIKTGDEGWRAYARLHAMMTQDARWTTLAAKTFGNVAELMIARILEAEPRLGIQSAVQGYVFVVGSMVCVFADTRLLDHLSKGQSSSEDISANIEPLVRFGAAGIRALADQWAPASIQTPALSAQMVPAVSPLP